MARGSNFKKFNSQDREITLLQDNVEQALTQLLNISLLDGNLLQGIALEVGDNEVNHKLNRAIRGYIIVRSSAATSIYDKNPTNTTITLNSTAATTVSIWFF